MVRTKLTISLLGAEPLTATKFAIFMHNPPPSLSNFLRGGGGGEGEGGGREGGSSPIKVETNFDKGAKNLPPPFALIIFNFYPEFPDSCLFDASDIYS